MVVMFDYGLISSIVSTL